MRINNAAVTSLGANETDMYYNVEILRAFTDSKIQTLGNPAGVVRLKRPLRGSDMRQIAIKADQPMTAFVLPRPEDGSFFDIRYYDPKGRESHICGHATIAAAEALRRSQIVAKDATVQFYLNPAYFGGEDRVLRAFLEEGSVKLELPTSPLVRIDNKHLSKSICRILGIDKRDLISICYASDTRDYVLGVSSAEVLLGMRPDFEEMRKLAEGQTFKHEGIMVTSPAPQGSDYDIFSRVFLPITGVQEDIACGSGNCSIAPYWRQHGLVENQYKAVFPYPDGPRGFIGGTQKIHFMSNDNLIIITAEVEHVGRMRVPVRQTPSYQMPAQRIASAVV